MLIHSRKMTVLSLVGRVTGGVVISYLMFWVTWMWLHLDALAYLISNKDKKFKPSPPMCMACSIAFLLSVLTFCSSH
jgi:hypothetical protein